MVAMGNGGKYRDVVLEFVCKSCLATHTHTYTSSESRMEGRKTHQTQSHQTMLRCFDVFISQQGTQGVNIHTTLVVHQDRQNKTCHAHARFTHIGGGRGTRRIAGWCRGSRRIPAEFNTHSCGWGAMHGGMKFE